jgi:hypothetical protein
MKQEKISLLLQSDNVPFLRQINPVHTPILILGLFKIHFNIIILCINLQSSLFPSGFPN